MTVAPHLDKNEKENYNPNVDVCYSVNAWMGKQQCQWAVRRVLEKIGDEKILLQCDGYESFLNALKS